MDAVTPATTRIVHDIHTHAMSVSDIIICLTWIGTKDFPAGDGPDTRRNKGVRQFAACHHVDRGLVPFESPVHQIVSAFLRIEGPELPWNKGDERGIISPPLELCLKFEVALAGMFAQRMTADFLFPQVDGIPPVSVIRCDFYDGIRKIPGIRARIYIGIIDVSGFAARWSEPLPSCEPSPLPNPLEPALPPPRSVHWPPS